MPEKPLEPRKAPSQERSQEMVEWIIEGAARILDESGYSALTTNRVADEAGVSVGSVYQYFPTKDAIVAELTRRHVEQAIAGFRSVFAGWVKEPPASMDDAVRSLVVMATAMNEPALLHRSLYDRSALNAGAEEAKAVFVAEAVGGVVSLLRHFELANGSAALTAQLLVWSTWGVVHEVLLDQPAGEARDAAVNEWVRFLLAGLTSRGSS